MEQKYKDIQEELREQAIEQGQIGKVYDDLIDHIVYLFRLKDQLEEDIQTKGIREITKGGNGFPIEKDNKSVDKLLKVSVQLQKTLKDLGLQEPVLEEDGDEGLL